MVTLWLVKRQLGWLLNWQSNRILYNPGASVNGGNCDCSQSMTHLRDGLDRIQGMLHSRGIFSHQYRIPKRKWLHDRGLSPSESSLVDSKALLDLALYLGGQDFSCIPYFLCLRQLHVMLSRSVFPKATYNESKTLSGLVSGEVVVNEPLGHGI